MTAEGALGALLALNVAWFGFGTVNWLMLTLHIEHRRLMAHEHEQMFFSTVEQMMAENEQIIRRAMEANGYEMPKETLH